ncbi:MAG: ATP-grasp domain-containing protein [Lachnospiraceae bacterium]|nr:ATP-grasp domain-containing protein [Lachnospiraceae bacterium]
MKNFVFLSPNFPENYYLFIRQLKNNGLRVLGIGDCPFDDLRQELKEDLTEYYKVDSLENYEACYRAMGYFIHKYGRIDWLETNNEYWLERDAQLRTDFNITSGFRNQDIHAVKYKSAMKEYYAKAGIPTARYQLIYTRQDAYDFVAEVGYPVVVKPDNGVGASCTYKLKSDENLNDFLDDHLNDGIVFIMEEFVEGYVVTYDGIIDSNGQPIFETGNVSPTSIMDMVNFGDDCIFYIRGELPEELREAGRATVASFGVKSRFVHFEFFILTKDMEHIGPAGTIAGLEVNMRPSGGVSPDMMNYSNHTDVYKIWADMIAFDHSTLPAPQWRQLAAYAGRRDHKNYKISDEKILRKYADHIMQVGRVADALSGDMGNRMFIANFDTVEEVNAYYADTTATE